MAETVVASGQRFYPANNGASGTALARDEEIYIRKAVRGANFVIGGDLTYSAGSLSVTIQALTVFIDGRQVLREDLGNYTFNLPANSTSYIMVKRNGSLVYRDTNNPATDSDLLLHTVVTDGTGVVGVPTDNRRKNQFTEVGLNDGEKVYLSTDRAKQAYYDSATGRIRIVGTVQPDRIVGLPDPLLGDEAATRDFVLGQATKVAKLASTGNLTLSGTQTIDAGSAGIGDIVLAKDQTAGAENGLYAVAAGAWTRAPTLDASAEAVAGLAVYVQQGTVNGKTTWTLTTTAAVTLGTTPLAFEQIRDPMSIQTAAFTAAPNRAYGVDHATPATRLDVTLPVASQGDMILLRSGSNTGMMRVIAPTAKGIKFNGSASANGPTGYWQSVSIYSALVLLGLSSGDWQVIRVVGQFVNEAGVTQHALDSLQPAPVGAPTAANHGVRLQDIGGSALAIKFSVGSFGSARLSDPAALATTAATFGLYQNTAGTVLVCLAHDGTNTNAYVSSDGGLNWTKSANLTVPSTTLGACVDVFVQDASNFTIFYLTSSTNLRTATTSNGGSSFTTNNATISAASGSFALTAYSLTSAAYSRNSTGATFVFSKTVNTGATWSAEVTITTTGNSQGALVTGDGGTTWVFVVQSSSTTTTIISRVSTDSGASFAAGGSVSTAYATTLASGNHAMAIGVSASAYFAVVVESGTGSPVKVYRTTNTATSWALAATLITPFSNPSGQVAQACLYATGVSGIYDAVVYGDGNTVQSTSTQMSLMRSTDSGVTWVVQSQGRFPTGLVTTSSLFSLGANPSQRFFLEDGSARAFVTFLDQSAGSRVFQVAQLARTL